LNDIVYDKNKIKNTLMDHIIYYSDKIVKLSDKYKDSISGVGTGITNINDSIDQLQNTSLEFVTKLFGFNQRIKSDVPVQTNAFIFDELNKSIETLRNFLPDDIKKNPTKVFQHNKGEIPSKSKSGNSSSGNSSSGTIHGGSVNKKIKNYKRQLGGNSKIMDYINKIPKINNIGELKKIITEINNLDTSKGDLININDYNKIVDIVVFRNKLTEECVKLLSNDNNLINRIDVFETILLDIKKNIESQKKKVNEEVSANIISMNNILKDVITSLESLIKENGSLGLDKMKKLIGILSVIDNSSIGNLDLKKLQELVNTIGK
jgi:hypothetical protein